MPNIQKMTLLPCPYCGGEAIIGRMGTNRVSMCIACSECGAHVECGATSVKNSMWNTRTKGADKFNSFTFNDLDSDE